MVDAHRDGQGYDPMPLRDAPDGRPVATISVDLDPVDVHLRGYGVDGLPPDRRVHDQALPRLLDLFARHRIRATFFLLARDVPWELETLPSIRAAGHEVASHGIDHLPGIARRAHDEIRAELLESRLRLQERTGASVVGFRAPDWAAGDRLISALLDTGYRYDASLMPSPFLPAGRLFLAVRARRVRDALAVRPPPSFRRAPFDWSVPGGSLREFPLAVGRWSRVPLYHTLRPSMRDGSFARHLDGLAARGEPMSYALHGVDALGLVEDHVDQRLRHHPGMAATLQDKLDLLDRTLGAIADRFGSLPFGDRIDIPPRPRAIAGGARA